MSILRRATAHPRRVTRVKYIIIILLLLLFLAPARTKRSLLSKSSTGGDNRPYYGVINVEKFSFRWQARTCCSTTQTHAGAPRAHVPPATPAVVSGYRIIRFWRSARTTELRAPSTGPTTSCPHPTNPRTPTHPTENCATAILLSL